MCVGTPAPESPSGMHSPVTTFSSRRKASRAISMASRVSPTPLPPPMRI